MFLSPLSQAPPTLHPRPAHTPSQGGTLALRPLPDAIPRDRRARSSRATPQFARRLSQVLGIISARLDGHKATIERFIATAPLTKVSHPPPQKQPPKWERLRAGPRRRRRPRAARRRTQGCAPSRALTSPLPIKETTILGTSSTPDRPLDPPPSRSRADTSPPTPLTPRVPASPTDRRGAEAQGRQALRQGRVRVPAVHRARRRVRPGRGGSLRGEIAVSPRAATLGRRRRRRHPRAQDLPEERRRARLPREGVPRDGAGEEGQG